MMEPRTTGELELEIMVLQREGLSQRQIAKKLKVGRKRVRNVLRKYEKQRQQGHDALDSHKKRPRSSKLDPWLAFIRGKLEKYPDMTAVRMLEELQAAGFEGGITIVQECVRKLRPKPKREPTLRFETGPGEQGQMDWSPYKIRFRNAGVQKVLCFSYILGFSRRQYLDFTTHRDFYTMIRKHQSAFEYFQGVPQQCLYDGEKTVILRWEAGRPMYNPGFLAFLAHYGCRPVGCLPGRAKTKGKVERPFQSVEGHLLNGREFDDLEDLRRFTSRWLREYSDAHIHGTTRRTPLELFWEQERQALQPLPTYGFDTSEVRYVVGHDDGFVRFQTNLYSIPFAYILMHLVLRATEDEVEIYDPAFKVIAHHPRLPPGAGQQSLQPKHHEAARERHGLEPVRQRFLELGTHAEAFLGGLIQLHP